MASGFTNLLKYESDIYLDVIKEDCLLITAKGLGLDRILLKVVQTFCRPENLVIMLNTFPDEQNFLIDELMAAGVSHLPRVITANTLTHERENMYLSGGVFFVTARILVVDMLTNRLPIDFVTGILIHRAHKIGHSSQEGFILRMFREVNSNGFIKGFSDSPTSFTMGYCQVERVMKQLFVKKLYLRPRFHADVTSCLEMNKPEVIELGVNLTPHMSRIQLSIMDLIEYCLRELKKSATGLDIEDLTLENSLIKTFDKLLKLHLEPLWNQLNSKTKQLVLDLKILRTLLIYLTQYDCVTFYNFLQSLRANIQNKNSIWMFLDAANSVFVNAKARIFGVEKINESGGKYIDSKIESSPKWDALVEIIKETEQLNMKNIPPNHDDSASEDIHNIKDSGNVLICASDERTCYQLRQLLCLGSTEMLQTLFDESPLSGLKTVDKSSHSKRKFINEDELPSAIRRSGVDDVHDVNIKVLQDCVVVIHPLFGCSDPYSLLRKLYELEPRFVVLYDAHIEFVRQLEIFKASRPNKPLCVYFLVYSGSVEEQRYLTSLRKEKEAFELLIRQKGDMVIPEERQAKTDAAKKNLRGKIVSSVSVNTRKSGGREVDNLNKKVIVDMREFRSELPDLLHKRGMDIEPVTLEVGDYILSPEMCIERKSISDLVGSLNNGRLYTQSVSMTRYYKRAILLIEFDEGKSFSLQAKKSLSTEVSLQNISSKLSLLTIHFPSLRIIWSQSPHITAEIFEDLKNGCEDPDSKTAMAIGVDQANALNESLYNILPFDVVQKLPGISTKNSRFILNNYKNFHDLVNSPENSLAEHLSNASKANKLYEFMTKKQDITQASLKRKK